MDGTLQRYNNCTQNHYTIHYTSVHKTSLVNWFCVPLYSQLVCVHLKQHNFGNIQFWGQTDRQTDTLKHLPFQSCFFAAKKDKRTLKRTSLSPFVLFEKDNHPKYQQKKLFLRRESHYSPLILLKQKILLKRLKLKRIAVSPFQKDNLLFDSLLLIHNFKRDSWIKVPQLGPSTLHSEPIIIEMHSST